MANNTTRSAAIECLTDRQAFLIKGLKENLVPKQRRCFVINEIEAINVALRDIKKCNEERLIKLQKFQNFKLSVQFDPYKFEEK